ncbi:MAG TPA: hypothetical protein VD905_05195 [Flavobacteriales bacterium]|nr:hypothetical protein [Flavobacteriales bacterium]
MKSLWQTISNIGLSGHENTQERRQVHLINRILLLACIFTPAFIPFFVLTGNYFSTLSQCIYSCIFPFFFLLSRMRKFEPALLLAFYTATSNIMFASVVNYNIGSEYLLLPMGLIPFMTLNNIRHSMLVASTTMTGFFIVQVLKETVDPYVVMSENNRLFLFHSVLCMCFVISMTIMYNFRAVLNHYEMAVLKQKADIEQQKQVIEEKQKELLDSIHYARRIQTALLPTEKYIDKNLTPLSKKI